AVACGYRSGWLTPNPQEKHVARIGLTVAVLGVAGALAGCGADFADSTPEEIVAEAKEAMGDLTSVKVSGTITNEGQEITLDIQSSADGDCTGSIGIDGGTAELLGVGGSTWMRPDEAFWRTFAGPGAEQVLSLVGEKWVVVPADEDSFNEFCDVDELLDEMLKDEDDDDSTYSTSGTEELDGQEVVAVDNEDAEDGDSTGYVLVDEPHYLVKIEKTDGDSTGTVTFSEFDETFEVEAPAEDDVIDLDQISG
ncbi:MAG: hypothetical protein WBP61_15260, partial [Nocardioides sp.]